MCLGGVVCFLDALSGVECTFSISSRAVSLIGWSNPIGICSNVIDSPSGFHWFAPWHLALRAIWSDVRCQIHIWPAHPAPSVQHNPCFPSYLPRWVSVSPADQEPRPRRSFPKAVPPDDVTQTQRQGDRQPVAPAHTRCFWKLTQLFFLKEQMLNTSNVSWMPKYFYRCSHFEGTKNIRMKVW